MPTEDREKKAEREGRESHERGEGWTANDYRKGSREWFAFEDGRRDAGAKDNNAGNPAWG